MDKMETVKNVITNRGRALADKAKDVAQIAKLKAQIVSCEEVIRKNYLEIGKMVYEAYEEARNSEVGNAEIVKLPENPGKPTAWEERYKKQCTAITNAQNAIADLERRIQELK